jgi:hypothetical protein
MSEMWVREFSLGAMRLRWADHNQETPPPGAVSSVLPFGQILRWFYSNQEILHEP